MNKVNDITWKDISVAMFWNVREAIGEKDNMLYPQPNDTITFKLRGLHVR